MRSLQLGMYDNMIGNVVGSFSGYIQVHSRGYWDEKVIDNAFEATDETLNKVKEIKIAHDSLISIYDEAKVIDPYNLARAISSLDCWSEQQEENWQTWDINNCKDVFLSSMHDIYTKISEQKEDIETDKTISDFCDESDLKPPF